ncbi:MAG: lipase family protein [Desulfobacterales bacterium]
MPLPESTLFRLPPDRSWQSLLRPGASTSYFRLSPRPSFDEECSEFRTGTAWWLCEFARLIYRMEADEIGRRADGLRRDEVLRSVGWREDLFINRGGIQCALLRRDTERPRLWVLVFRGTSGLGNCILDLNARPAAWVRGGRVHRGFMKALGRVWPALSAALSERRPERIYFCGHSLGGAVALLAASLRMPAAVYSYGAPLTGDREFAQTLGMRRVFDVINGKDVVPVLPPEISGYGYVPAGARIDLSADEGLVRQGLGASAAATPGLPHPASPAGSRRRWFAPPDSLSDHAPINYRIGLERILLSERSRSPGVSGTEKTDDGSAPLTPGGCRPPSPKPTGP